MLPMDTVISVLEQIHDGKTHIGEYFSTIFESLPVGVVWVDKNHRFEGCNNFWTIASGVKDPELTVDKTLIDLDTCREQEAKIAIADDLDVFNFGKPQTHLRPYHFHFRNGHSILVRDIKAPIYDANKNIQGLS